MTSSPWPQPEKLVALWKKCPFVDNVIALRDPKSLPISAADLRARQVQLGRAAAQFAPLRRRERGRRRFRSASATRGADAACF